MPHKFELSATEKAKWANILQQVGVTSYSFESNTLIINDDEEAIQFAKVSILSEKELKEYISGYMPRNDH